MRTTVIALFVSTAFIVGCTNNDITFEDVTMKEPDTTQVDINKPLDASSIKQNAQGAKNIGGYSAKIWGRMLKNCIQSVQLKKGDAEYLGISNTIGVGTITDSKFEGTYRLVDANTFSQDELNLIVHTDNTVGCGYTMEAKLDLDGALGSRIQIDGNDSLNFAVRSIIKSGRTVKLHVKSWQKMEIILGPLQDALTTNPTQPKKKFLEELKKPDRILMNRAILVNGFTAEMTVEKELNASLTAQLSTGATSSIPNSNADIKIGLKNNNTLVLETDQSFILYGKYVKLKFD